MDAPIDDLSLLNEGFASSAIPSSQQNETTEYLVEGVWVPQNVFLAWAKEQEEWPTSMTTRRLYTDGYQHESGLKQSGMIILDGPIPDFIDPKKPPETVIIGGFSRNGQMEESGPITQHMQAEIYRRILEKSQQVSSPSSESSTMIGDHTPKYPDNG